MSKTSNLKCALSAYIAFSGAALCQEVSDWMDLRDGVAVIDASVIDARTSFAVGLELGPPPNEMSISISPLRNYDNDLFDEFDIRDSKIKHIADVDKIRQELLSLVRSYEFFFPNLKMEVGKYNFEDGSYRFKTSWLYMMNSDEDDWTPEATSLHYSYGASVQPELPLDDSFRIKMDEVSAKRFKDVAENGIEAQAHCINPTARPDGNGWGYQCFVSELDILSDSGSLLISLKRSPGSRNVTIDFHF